MLIIMGLEKMSRASGGRRRTAERRRACCKIEYSCHSEPQRGEASSCGRQTGRIDPSPQAQAWGLRLSRPSVPPPQEAPPPPRAELLTHEGRAGCPRVGPDLWAAGSPTAKAHRRGPARGRPPDHHHVNHNHQRQARRTTTAAGTTRGAEGPPIGQGGHMAPAARTHGGAGPQPGPPSHARWHRSGTGPTGGPGRPKRPRAPPGTTTTQRHEGGHL